MSYICAIDQGTSSSRAMIFDKVNNTLQLSCVFKRSRKAKYKVEYTINTLTNIFNVSVTDLPVEPEDGKDADETVKVSKAYFYFYIHGNCPECNSSHCNSSDIELTNSPSLLYFSPILA